MTRVLALLVALVLAGCTAAPTRSAPRPGPWPEAEARFRSDARWLGGDAIYSVALGGDRVLWLFGDSFVDPLARGDRRQSTMVRNTIAVQDGLDPETANLRFHWRTDERGAPQPFFAGDGDTDWWPLDGSRVPGGPLLLFGSRVRATPGEGLGFAIDGWRLVAVDDPDADPSMWRPREVLADRTHGAVVQGVAVAPHEGGLLVLGTLGNGPHAGFLSRLELPLGDEPGLVPFDGGRFARGAQARVVLDDAGPECSLSECDGRWLHVQSRGFGATTIAMRSAVAPTGPWSEPRVVHEPAESRAERPFVYAAKAHPELDAGPGLLAISYATNSFDFADLFTPRGQRELYWPRFVRVPSP